MYYRGRAPLGSVLGKKKKLKIFLVSSRAVSSQKLGTLIFQPQDGECLIRRASGKRRHQANSVPLKEGDTHRGQAPRAEQQVWLGPPSSLHAGFPSGGRDRATGLALTAGGATGQPPSHADPGAQT